MYPYHNDLSHYVTTMWQLELLKKGRVPSECLRLYIHIYILDPLNVSAKCKALRDVNTEISNNNKNISQLTEHVLCE